MIIDYTASLFAILGAFLVTSPHRDVRLLAFLFWVVSNNLLMLMFIAEGRWPMAVMYAVFLVAAALGVWTNRK